MAESISEGDAKVKEYLSNFGVEMPVNDNKAEDSIAASRAAAVEAIAKTQGAEGEKVALPVTRNLSAIEKQVQAATVTPDINNEITEAILANKKVAEALETEVNGAARAAVEETPSKPPLDEKLIAEAVITESPIEVTPEVVLNPTPIGEAPVVEMYAPVPKVMPEQVIVGTAPEVVLPPEDIRQLTPEMVEKQLEENPEAVIEIPPQPEVIPEPVIEEKVEVPVSEVPEESEEEVVAANDNAKEELEVIAESSIERSPLFAKLSPEIQARLKKIYEAEPSSLGARIEWRIVHLSEIVAVLNEEVGDALEQKEIPRHPIARRKWLEEELKNLEQTTAAEKERASHIEQSVASLGAETLEKMDDELLKVFNTNAG